MALNTFGWTPSEVTTDSAGNVISGVTLTVFTDVTKANQVTGLFDKDGTTPLASGVVVSDNKGRFGFKASDAFSMLYVYDGSTADPWPIAAHEALDQGMASHAQAVADAQAAADSAAASAALVNAPADTAIKTAISNGATQSGAYLKTTFSGIAVNPVNVADKGAVGDGTTNDTAAVQAALNAGNVVELQPGKTYLVDALTFAKTNGRIIGNGATLKLRTSAAVFLTISGSGTKVEHVDIDANDLATNYTVDIAADTTDVTMRGCTVRNMSGGGTIALLRVRQGCNGFVLDGCRLRDLQTTNVGRGVLISGTTGTIYGVKIINNLIENIEMSTDGDGVVVQDFPGDVDVLISGNSFRACRKRAIKIQCGGVTATNNDIDFTWNVTYGAGYAGISVYGSRSVVANNRMRGVVSIGWVEIGSGTALTDVTVVNNIMVTDLTNRQASQEGIVIPASAPGLQRGTISGNQVYGSRHGIRLQNAVKDIAIVGNLIQECTGSAIVLDDNAGTVIDAVTIAANIVRTIANYYVATDGGAAPTNVTVMGNQGVANFGFFQTSAAPSSRLGFHGATPVAKATLAAAATDAATTQTLANDLRTKLIALGLFA